LILYYHSDILGYWKQRRKNPKTLAAQGFFLDLFVFLFVVTRKVKRKKILRQSKKEILQNVLLFVYKLVKT